MMFSCHMSCSRLPLIERGLERTNAKFTIKQRNALNNGQLAITHISRLEFIASYTNLYVE